MMMSSGWPSRVQKLLDDLTAWYLEIPDERLQFIEMVNIGGMGPSLRVIDYAVVNHCKEHDIEIYGVKVWSQYKDILRLTYSKSLFDPFRRGPYKCTLCGIQTSVGQLNFFRWALERGVMDYIRRYQLEIQQEMKQNIARNRIRNHDNDNNDMSVKKKKQQLTKRFPFRCRCIEGDDEKWVRFIIRQSTPPPKTWEIVSVSENDANNIL